MVELVSAPIANFAVVAVDMDKTSAFGTPNQMLFILLLLEEVTIAGPRVNWVSDG